MVALSKYTRRYVPAVAVIDLEIDRAIEEAALQVAPLFDHHQWKWAMSPEAVVPDEERITEEFRRLVRSLYRGNSAVVGCGRLFVERFQDGDGHILRFSLELGEVYEPGEEEGT